MKKVLLLLVGAVIGAGGYHVYSGFTAGAEAAEEYVEKDLSDAEVADGLVSADLNTRTAAFNQVGTLPVEAKKKALLAALGVSYAPTRLGAVLALGKDLGEDPEVFEKLLAVAEGDPDWDVQSTALETLSESGDLRVLDLSVRILEAGNASLAAKNQAAGILDNLTGRTTAEALGDHFDGATGAADDLMFEWSDWLEENRGKLTWDAGAGQFK